MNHPKNIPLSSTLTRLAHSSDTDKQETAEQLLHAVGNANDVLVRVQTVFPLALFPDTITVDRSKITITQRDFFKVGEVLSLRFEDILNVAAQVGPFFGSVIISTRFFNPDKPYTVDKLKRADALKVKRIVQGYLIARQNNIDCSHLTTPELAKSLDELGKVDRPDKL